MLYMEHFKYINKEHLLNIFTLIFLFIDKELIHTIAHCYKDDVVYPIIMHICTVLTTD